MSDDKYEDLFFEEGHELFAPDRSDIEKRIARDLANENKIIKVSALIKVLGKIAQGKYT